MNHDEVIEQIRARNTQRQAKINNAGDNLIALSHVWSQEHDDRTCLLAIIDEMKREHSAALGLLTEHYDEQLRQRGLSSAVTAKTFDECHEALRATEQERDRERARADKAEADAKHVRHINSTLATELVEAGKEIEAQRDRAIAAEAALTAAREKVKGLPRSDIYLDERAAGVSTSAVGADGCL